MPQKVQSIFDFVSKGENPVQQACSIIKNSGNADEHPADVSKLGHKPKLLDCLRESLG